MTLNTLSGRTYDDLSAYPVFPWVIQDWTSPALDLSCPSTFRDLSKPIGALNPDRLAGFCERYDSLLHDPDMDAFHYGSHYSSAGVVLWYLLRLQPFTELGRNLQGGRFDHADRLLHSLPDAWNQVLTNSSDVKEMIPEFFYCAAALRNSEGLQLGMRQDGSLVGDVALPPWANGSADEFIRIHREALESDHVSANLHQWVDLIWGYKQRGPQAVEAHNVFYYLTYEGAVNVDALECDLQRAAIQDQIKEFGQTPMQLFPRRHARRTPLPPSANPLLNAPDHIQRCQGASPSLSVEAGAGRGVVALLMSESSKGTRLVQVSAGQQVLCHRWVLNTAYTFGAQLPTDYVIEGDPLPGRSLNSPGHADTDIQAQAAAFVLLPGTSILLSAGHWDNSLRAHDCDSGRLLQAVTAHRALVTCLCLTSSHPHATSALSETLGASPHPTYTLVAGSRDTTLSVWRPRAPNRNRRAPLDDAPSYWLYGHEDAVVAVWASDALRVVASASARGTILLHSLFQGSLIRTLCQLPHPVTLLSGSPLQPAVVAYTAADQRVYALHLHGYALAEARSPDALQALDVSACGRFVIVGGKRSDPHRLQPAVPRLLWLHNLKVKMAFKRQLVEQEGDITSIVATKEGCLALGTSKGAVVLLSPDPRRTITPHLNLASTD